MRRTNIALILLVVLIAGCGRGDDSETPVARFDGEAVTLDKMVARMDSARGMSQAQVAEYARRWINDEILYREAARQGLDNSEEVKARVDEVRRQLAINALLQREVYTNQSAENSPEEVAAYYADHSREFVLTTDVVLASSVLFRDREAASSFRTTVLRGTSWNEALVRMVSDPQRASSVSARVDSTYFSQSTLLPVELWRVASAATKPEPSFPVATNDGFYVLCVWKTSRQGQVADQTYVEREIRNRLTIERRRRAYNGLLERLRSRHTVELFLSEEADTSSLR